MNWKALWSQDGFNTVGSMLRVWPKQQMIFSLVITGSRAIGLHIAKWWPGDVKPIYNPLFKCKTRHHTDGTWWKHGRVFPIGFVRDLHPHALRPDILRGKMKGKQDTTAPLKNTAWSRYHNKQNTRPRLPLMQPSGSLFLTLPSAHPFAAQLTVNSTVRPEVQAWGWTYFAPFANTGNYKSQCK